MKHQLLELKRNGIYCNESPPRKSLSELEVVLSNKLKEQKWQTSESKSFFGVRESQLRKDVGACAVARVAGLGIGMWQVCV